MAMVLGVSCVAVTGSLTWQLSVVEAMDESADEMTVTFKEGERYILGDSNITSNSGVSSESGTCGRRIWRKRD